MVLACGGRTGIGIVDYANDASRVDAGDATRLDADTDASCSSSKPIIEDYQTLDAGFCMYSFKARWPCADSKHLHEIDVRCEGFFQFTCVWEGGATTGGGAQESCSCTNINDTIKTTEHACGQY